MTVLPDIQLVLRPGIVEVRRSKPDATLLPTVDLTEGVRRLGALVRENSCGIHHARSLQSGRSLLGLLLQPKIDQALGLQTAALGDRTNPRHQIWVNRNQVVTAGLGVEFKLRRFGLIPVIS
jgi:hypothetical protein